MFVIGAGIFIAAIGSTQSGGGLASVGVLITLVGGVGLLWRVVGDR